MAGCITNCLYPTRSACLTDCLKKHVQSPLFTYQSKISYYILLPYEENYHQLSIFYEDKPAMDNIQSVPTVTVSKYYWQVLSTSTPVFQQTKPRCIPSEANNAKRLNRLWWAHHTEFITNWYACLISSHNTFYHEGEHHVLDKTSSGCQRMLAGTAVSGALQNLEAKTFVSQFNGTPYVDQSV